MLNLSIISDPPFAETNKVLDAFVKDLWKTGKIAGVVHKRAISMEQLKKLLESGELGPADGLNPDSYSGRLGSTLASIFEDGDVKNQRHRQCFLRLRKTPQGVEYYELNRSQPAP